MNTPDPASSRCPRLRAQPAPRCPGGLAAAVVLLALALPRAAAAAEPVYVDDQGVIRWTANEREVALFGANYCLPSALDYRAAGYLKADRKRLIEQDMAHFARMGWDGLRVCLWGDWENSDRAGNLIANDHLDLMDYLIHQAGRRGIHILLAPITTYSALWPDGQDSDAIQGFSKHFRKAELGTHPEAIAAQVNYVRQVLEHVNPYTGVALKDEPAILFIEPINEPAHHSEDLPGSIAYIDALVAAVRSTGCSKLVFHNVSQDMRITPAIKASRAQGVSFAWYPTGLNGGRALTENYLRTVDAYPALLRPDLLQVPKLVYEFDSPDIDGATLYPAMVRAFRGVGAQFAAMFAYDMLATAPYNLGWQTHFLNLVASPRKAASAVIAAEAMRRLPRYSHFGDYPGNLSFAGFRLDPVADTSEFVSAETYLHAGSITTPAPEPASLRRIAGVGSSPVVTYEGRGIYFLDRVEEGLWRLEVHPDALTVQDPFAQITNHQTVSVRLIARAWPMRVKLPDLGEEFSVSGVNNGNSDRSTARGGRFVVRPGVYALQRGERSEPARWPERVGQIGFAEYHTVTTEPWPPQARLELAPSYLADRAVRLAAEVAAQGAPEEVRLHVRAGGEPEFRALPMQSVSAYRYEAALDPLPTGAAAAGPGQLEAFLTVRTDGTTYRFPGDDEVWSATVVAATDPLPLFRAERDAAKLVYSRIGDGIRHGIFEEIAAQGSDPAALRIFFPLSRDPELEDYTAQLPIRDQVRARQSAMDAVTALTLHARAHATGQKLHVTLVEFDGTSWSTVVALREDWTEHRVPLEQFTLGRGVMLPLGFPERWNYWMPPAAGRGGEGDRPRPRELQHVQLAFRRSQARHGQDQAGAVTTDPWADIVSLALQFAP